jgi:hypothetical protein
VVVAVTQALLFCLEEVAATSEEPEAVRPQALKPLLYPAEAEVASEAVELQVLTLPPSRDEVCKEKTYHVKQACQVLEVVKKVSQQSAHQEDSAD